MTDTFIKKHRERAEEKKLGRVECHYEIDGKGRMKNHYTRADATKRPPLVTQEMVPVGKGRGTVKVGK